MSLELFLELFFFAILPFLGVVGGCLADRFPASVKTALAFCFLPMAGVGLMKMFC